MEPPLSFSTSSGTSPETHPEGSFHRFRRLDERLREQEGGYSVGFIEKAAACVAMEQPQPEGRAANRTIWHSLRFPESRRLRIDFYLGDEPAPDDPRGFRVVRSGWRELALEQR